MKHAYQDMISLNYIKSNKRPHLSAEQRAAQFSPFAALTGFEDFIVEEARQTDAVLPQTETLERELNKKIAILDEIYPKRVVISIVHFIPDIHKNGGYYDTFTGTFKKIDTTQRRIIMEDDRSIYFDYIHDITGDIFSDTDSFSDIY